MTDMRPLQMKPWPMVLRYIAQALRDGYDPSWAVEALEVAARQYEGSWGPLGLLGKQVEVTVAEGKPVVEGRLLAYGTDGEFEIEDDTGAIHYCWPLLKIREVHT